MPIEANEIKTEILSGNVKIVDKGLPYSTEVYIDGKQISKFWCVMSFSYRADNEGERVLKIKYIEKPKEDAK